MRFLVDEASFPVFAGDPNTAIQALSQIVDQRTSRGEPVIAWDQLWSSTLSGSTLTDLLFTKPSRLDQALSQWMMAFLGRCANYDAVLRPTDLTGWSGGTVGIASAVDDLTSRRASCCIALPTTRPPKDIATVDTKSGEVAFVQSNAEVVAFYRSIFEIEQYDINAYLELAALAFPALYFMPNLPRQAGRFHEEFTTLRPKLTIALGVLNDEFGRLFSERSGDPGAVAAALRPYGVNATVESAQTRNNRKAWAERRIEATDGVGQALYCEWHVKLSPTHDRIHFHPGTPGFQNGKLIIGIFHKHLKT